jgi:GNAT superfamily N-acetyltransferase
MNGSGRPAAEWWARMHLSMAHAWRTLAAGSRGAHLVELGGVMAAVVPAIPERSVFNSVLYDRPEQLARVRDELARTYEDAGVRAWTVWVPEHDRDTAELLASAGHVLDAAPLAMGLELAALPAPDPGGLEWSSDGSLDELKRINDAAYGYVPGTFDLGIGTPPEDAWRIYEARLAGEPACVVSTTDVEGDCGVWWVATMPDARGRGLAGRLLHVALAEARERGIDTSTLQATKMGRSIYRRLGYVDFGEIRMWEWRR